MLFEKKLGVTHGEWSLGTPHVGDTAILFFMPVNVAYSFKDPHGRYSIVDYVWEGKTFTSLCIYAPAQQNARKKFLAEDLRDHLTSKPPQNLFLMAGDWNFVEETADKISV